MEADAWKAEGATVVVWEEEKSGFSETIIKGVFAIKTICWCFLPNPN
jgi:hypothetical protein